MISMLKKRNAVLIAVMCGSLGLGAATVCAAEVYSWVDENGVVNYSDIPHAEMPEDQQQSLDPVMASAGVGTETRLPADEAQATSYAQERREEIANSKRSRRTKASEQAQNCSMHRQRLEQMEPVRRVMYTNEAGETKRLDDNERMAMVDGSRQYLEENCQ